MADTSDPFALNIAGVTDLVESDTNKIRTSGNSNAEGAAGEKHDTLGLDMTDEELLKLRDTWEGKYATYETKLKVIVSRNLESYLGKKANGQWLTGEDNIASNIQFQAEETFLAAALAKNPEPVVYADNTDEGNAISDAIKTMLSFHSNELAIKDRLGIMVRQWSINHLGVMKFGWDKKLNDVSIDNRRIEDFVFDPHGYVDVYGDFTSYLGERITVTAEKLIELFPKSKEYITLEVDGKIGSEVTYTEWWTDEYCFTSFKEEILDKHKNEYFRYPEEQKDENGEPVLDQFGQPIQLTPRNHFAFPKKPYMFLSVYSLQKQPHDVTGLIEQNIPNQNRLTRRTDQIDLNVSAANNSWALSEDNFNQETGKQFATARKKGSPTLIPSGGPIDKAILPLHGQPLPSGIMEAAQQDEEHILTSWGVNGITATPQDEDQTARGMILNQSHDTSRIGGGIGSKIERVANNVFNWLVQGYYVFYDEQHFAAVMGSAKAVEYVEISNANLDRQLVVSVSPDSLRPRDEVTQINLAQSLFDKGAIGPKTLLKMLDFPDPDEAAGDGVLYKIDPMAYLQMNYPDLAQQLQQAQQQKAQLDMLNGAQGAALSAQAEASVAPEVANGEPAGPLSSEPASASLSQVPI